MQEPEEQRLIDLARDGDGDALGRVLEHHHGRLYNTILRMVGNSDDAAELTQETLLRVVRHFHEYDRRCRLNTWMTRIGMNLAISHLRKRRLRRHASLDQPGRHDGDGQSAASLAEQLPDDGNPQPASCVEKAEMLDHLHNALAQLDDDHRSVLLLRDIQEMDYQQVAEALQVPLGTVKSRIFRARMALRDILSRSERRPASGDSTRAAVGSVAEVRDG